MFFMGHTDLYLYLPPRYGHRLQPNCSIYIAVKYLRFARCPDIHRLPILSPHGSGTCNMGRQSLSHRGP